MKKSLLFFRIGLFVLAGISTLFSAERQLTFNTDVNNALDNNLNFSPDNKWLCYDTRPLDGMGGLENSLTIEKVNVETGQIVVIHAAADPIPGIGPGVSAVSYFPTEDKVIAIHGLPSTLKYEQFRRFGSIFSPTDGTADLVVADARDVTEPYTPGALRGGTHRHEPSGDGKWIGFTYNDMIMYNLDADHRRNLRTVGVTKLGTPVTVDKDAAGENQDGIGFSVLVVKVKPESEVTPNTEEIFRAADDCWVGDRGYKNSAGQWQRARAFIGQTKRTLPDNSVVTRNEVFIVDIPEDITVPGADGPLEGTATSFPMPPAGTVQRMLTHSASNCGGILRASRDGSRIAFNRADANGVQQIYLVSPLGGEAVQATFLPTACTKQWWHPSGNYIICLSAGSIWATNVIPGDANFGKSWMLTDPTPDANPDALVFSSDGKLIAFNRKLDVGRPDGKKVNQIFVVDFLEPNWPWSGEKQLTFGKMHNYALDNNLNFSPDNKWLCYDTRPLDGMGGLENSLTIEKVNVETGQIVVIHAAADPIPGIGPGVSAVSYFPTEDKVIAIHGLPSTLKYEQFRRFGSIFSPTDGTADLVVADARDVTEPYTPGALRGGTHRHEPSGDGKWIGFTYNDMIMYNLDADHRRNLRTVGVTKLGTPVTVDKDAAGENQDGIGFSVLVVKVKPESEVTPNTEEIFRAADDCWVGDRGYKNSAGQWQRARAFIGQTKRTLPDNSVVTRNEVFIVDIPEDITVPGADGPLEGTATSFPMPPAGTVQRMLTHSASNCGGILRASRDGSRIAFNRADANGVQQIYLVSPLGGEAVQATFLPTACTKQWWHPSGNYIICLSAGSIWATNVIPGDANFGKSWMLTDPTPDANPDAFVVSSDGQLVAFNRKLDMGRGDGKKVNQIFITKFTEMGTGVSASSTAALPQGFTLEQNYPNPFNPQTMIQFYLPQAAAVTVQVFNVNGELVKTLLNNRRQAAGSHQISWNGTTDQGALASSGIYFYRLQTEQATDVKRMVLIK
ncbi:MAG TPA: DUF3748 domain-containing protein [bacterium]|nr:DUF3748 domain-containing protein [bacterium]